MALLALPAVKLCHYRVVAAEMRKIKYSLNIDHWGAFIHNMFNTSPPRWLGMTSTHTETHRHRNTCTWTCMHTHTHTHTYRNKHVIQKNVSTHTRTHLHLYKHREYTRIQKLTHKHAHAYTHKYTHTHHDIQWLKNHSEGRKLLTAKAITVTHARFYKHACTRTHTHTHLHTVEMSRSKVPMWLRSIMVLLYSHFVPDLVSH